MRVYAGIDLHSSNNYGGSLMKKIEGCKNRDVNSKALTIVDDYELLLRVKYY